MAGQDADGLSDDPVGAVGALLRARGRDHRVQAERGLLVLDSGVAQRLSEVSLAYAGARRAGATPEQAAAHVVGELDAQQARLSEDAGAGRVRLRVAVPRLLDADHTLPGPADLVVYPVLDSPQAATRLGPAQTQARGGLEAVGLAALGETLAEPVRVDQVALGGVGGWRAWGDIYTASRVLDTGRFLAELGADPRRHHLVVVPTSREAWVFPDAGPDLLAALRERAAQRFAEGPGPVSDAVYRWDGAALTT